MLTPIDNRIRGWMMISALGVLAGYWVYCRSFDDAGSHAVLLLSWLTVFAVLLMLTSLVLPSEPLGMPGCRLGLLLFGIAFAALGVTQRFLSPETCHYLTLGNYAVFYTGWALFLSWCCRPIRPYAGLLIAFLVFALPVLVILHQNPRWEMLSRPPWPAWGSPLCADFYDYWFVFRVSIWLALAGVGLALPSIIVYFRLKKD